MRTVASYRYSTRNGKLLHVRAGDDHKPLYPLAERRPSPCWFESCSACSVWATSLLPAAETLSHHCVRWFAVDYTSVAEPACGCISNFDEGSDSQILSWVNLAERLTIQNIGRFACNVSIANSLYIIKSVWPAVVQNPMNECCTEGLIHQAVRGQTQVLGSLCSLCFEAIYKHIYHGWLALQTWDALLACHHLALAIKYRECPSCDRQGEPPCA